MHAQTLGSVTVDEQDARWVAQQQVVNERQVRQGRLGRGEEGQLRKPLHERGYQVRWQEPAGCRTNAAVTLAGHRSTRERDGACPSDHLASIVRRLQKVVSQSEKARSVLDEHERGLQQAVELWEKVRIVAAATVADLRAGAGSQRPRIRKRLRGGRRSGDRAIQVAMPDEVVQAVERQQAGDATYTRQPAVPTGGLVPSRHSVATA